jgi:hypothetical protein
VRGIKECSFCRKFNLQPLRDALSLFIPSVFNDNCPSEAMGERIGFRRPADWVWLAAGERGISEVAFFPSGNSQLANPSGIITNKRAHQP